MASKVKLNYTNKDDIELFAKDNIRLINESISEVESAIKNDGVVEEYDITDIKNCLKDKLIRELFSKRDNLLDEFEAYDYKKNKLPEVANKFSYYSKDLEGVISGLVFEKLKEVKPNQMDKIQKGMITAVLDNCDLSDKQKKYIKADLSNIVKKSSSVILRNGFQVNLNNINSGIMTANAGDSAQFLFVSRAILAGYNCSNVDVRSSRYDAVIDYKGHIFKVQVKGISGNTISFKDRDRGGKGIDTKNPRNRGKRITSKDCDIYVAVDKQVGLCYIIPMKDIDPRDDDDIKSVNVKKVQNYLENWSVIDRLYEEL